MRTPPIEYEDLVAMGLSPSATIVSEGVAISAIPAPSRLVQRLLSAAMASQPPDGDRMAYMRHVRDLLMSLTDWTQAADSPLSEEKRAGWATYRQALRDLPQAYGGIGPIPWPQEPA